MTRLLKQICTDRTADMRRVWNTVSRMHMEKQREEENRMALHQLPRPRHKILSRISYTIEESVLQDAIMEAIKKTAHRYGITSRLR